MSRADSLVIVPAPLTRSRLGPASRSTDPIAAQSLDITVTLISQRPSSPMSAVTHGVIAGAPALTRKAGSLISLSAARSCAAPDATTTMSAGPAVVDDELVARVVAAAGDEKRREQRDRQSGQASRG